jgi:acyl carrier protein
VEDVKLDDSRQQIRGFVLTLAEQKGIASVGDADNLTESGIVDSLAIFRVIQFLEDTFKIRIPDDEILTENFESVDSIAAFVNAKRR